MPSSSLSASPCFRGLRDFEDKDATILRNVGNCLRIRTMWDPTRFDSSTSPLWETQIASYHCFSLLAYICSRRYSCNEVLTCNCNGAYESCYRSYNPIRTLTSANCRIVGFIFVKFIKTTLGAVATWKIAEILLRLGPNKTRLDTTRGDEQGFIRS